MLLRTGGKARTVPQVFIEGEHVGGCSDLLREASSGTLHRRLVIPRQLAVGSVELRPARWNAGVTIASTVMALLSRLLTALRTLLVRSRTMEAAEGGERDMVS